MRTNIIRGTVIFVAGFSLSSCQYGVEVAVSGSASNFAVSLKERGWFADEPAEFDDLILSTMQNGSYEIVWEINTIKQCEPHLSRLNYGQTPAGFTNDTPPTKLIEGQEYELDVRGCGRIGAAFFKIADGRIVSLPRPQ